MAMLTGTVRKSELDTDAANVLQVDTALIFLGIHGKFLFLEKWRSPYIFDGCHN